MVKLGRFLSWETKRRRMSSSMIFAYLALSAVLALGLATRLAWPWISRRLGSVPANDQTAIDRFLANRDETLLEVKREIWAGGPQGRFGSANIHGRPSRGRFYRVLALDAEGARYGHKLAAAGDKEQGDLTLFQQDLGGYWTRVLQ